jgi:tRNA modification GTPase
MNPHDTIAAISTAVGVAARMMVRLSGPAASSIAQDLASANLSPASASLGRIWPGISAWIYAFCAPRSYTGEDLVEFHIPGSPVLARMLLDEIVSRGARHAEPGEFTARAYFNGRIDLTQAEGVAATIGAHSERELRAARQLLGGELARRLRPVMEDVAQALALIEVGIDFSDEDVTFVSAEQVRDRCGAAIAALDGLLADSARFERLSHEPRIVLVGRPNAGKSTLLNALAGADRAVVSEVAGTTRDALWADVRLARGIVRVVDVAGIEEGSGVRVQGPAEEEIARQMREQAMREVATADLVALVEDSSAPSDRPALSRSPDLIVRTKLDLVMAPIDTGDWACAVSARSGVGMAGLRGRLDRLAFGPTAAGAGLALNARHVALISQASAALARAIDAIPGGSELVALELRDALDALGGVLGQISPDDLLGKIFSTFCIGK